MDKTTFYKWLKSQEGRDDPVGDFARDTRNFSSDPTNKNSLIEWRIFLSSQGATFAAKKAFERAWLEYRHEHPNITDKWYRRKHGRDNPGA